MTRSAPANILKYGRPAIDSSTPARRWWTDIDAIVYRSRTTPESSLNYAFFRDEGFEVEAWPLGERIDVLTDLVLHQGFTINWDIDSD